MFDGKHKLRDICPYGCVVCVQEKVWLDETLIIEHSHMYYQPFTWQQMCKLIMDSFHGYLFNKVKNEMKKWKQLKSLDISVNKPFKNMICTIWIKYTRYKGTKVHYTIKTADYGQQYNCHKLHA